MLLENRDFIFTEIQSCELVECEDKVTESGGSSGDRYRETVDEYAGMWDGSQNVREFIPRFSQKVPGE